MDLAAWVNLQNLPEARVEMSSMHWAPQVSRSQKGSHSGAHLPWWAGCWALGLQLPRAGETRIIHDRALSWVFVESPGKFKYSEDTGSAFSTPPPTPAFSFNWPGGSLGDRMLKATPRDRDVPAELITAVWEPEVLNLALAKPGPAPATSRGVGTCEKWGSVARPRPSPAQ